LPLPFFNCPKLETYMPFLLQQPSKFTSLSFLLKLWSQQMAFVLTSEAVIR
jgi:hypothetical protein